MDKDSLHGWTDAVRRQEDEGDSHGEVSLHLMAGDTQAGTLTESNCRQSHKSSLVTDTSLFRQTIKLDLFAFTGAP